MKYNPLEYWGNLAIKLSKENEKLRTEVMYLKLTKNEKHNNNHR